MIRFVLAALLVLGSAAVHAEDVPDCKDPKTLHRFPGSELYNCSQKDYDEVDVPMAVDADGAAVKKQVGGQVSTYDYSMPSSASEVQVARNFENALAKAGFKILVGAKSASPCCFVTGQLKDLIVNVETGGGGYKVTQVLVKEMQQQVEADASAMLDELNKNGHVAVYGINFDSGQATLTGDSNKVLEQVAKLLTDNADLKLRVEGHTDDSGKQKANLELSKKRAATVKAWLVKHGVASARLATEGFGSSKPVGDNKTEEGRAKNRRVELVKL